jgi:hypothetical protein
MFRVKKSSVHDKKDIHHKGSMKFGEATKIRKIRKAAANHARRPFYLEVA